MATLNSKRTTDGQALTFGLELELNIAFTEQELVDSLKAYNVNYTGIQKTHSGTSHSDLLAAEDYSKSCRSQYPSWAVAMPMDDKDPYTNPMLTSSTHNTLSRETGQLVRHRGYISEPLLMAQRVMQRHDLNPEVKAVIRNLTANQPEMKLAGSQNESDCLLARSADYSNWTLTNDHTLIGNLKSQLLSELPTKIGTSNIDSWDSHGIELISPIFELSNKRASIEELSRHLSSLRSSKSIDILASTWAGLHVHIGFSATKPSDLDLKTLQNLAYILLTNEDLITSLFPSHCSGIQPETSSEPEEPEDPYAGLSEEEFEAAWARDQALLEEAEATSDSSADSFASTTPTEQDLEALNEAQVIKAEASFTNHQNKLSNARHLAGTLGKTHPVSADDVATAVFSTTTIEELVHLLQKPKVANKLEGDVYRGYMYNFSNLYDFVRTGKGKPTVEFRQHECCIDAENVGKWVNFTHATVKMAEQMSRTPEYMPSPRTVDELTQWLGLDEEDRRYWAERHERFSKNQNQG